MLSYCGRMQLHRRLRPLVQTLFWSTKQYFDHIFIIPPLYLVLCMHEYFVYPDQRHNNSTHTRSPIYFPIATPWCEATPEQHGRITLDMWTYRVKTNILLAELRPLFFQNNQLAPCYWGM